MISIDYIISAVPQLFRGMGIAIVFTIVAISLSILSASILNIIRSANIRLMSVLIVIYVTYIRGTPMLVQLYIIYYLLPNIGIKLPAYVAGMLAIVLNSGAIMYGVIRGSILSIPLGQYEAAVSYGLRKIDIWRSVLLPQAMIKVLPQIINETIILLKATPLLAFITIVEVFRSAQLIYATNYRPVETLIGAAILFFIINYSLSKLGIRVEEKLKRRRG